MLADAGVAVRVLERAQVTGGRMATRQYQGRPADIGAAYFTTRDERFTAVARRWRERGLAREWTDTLRVLESGKSGSTTGPMRWAAPRGLRSLVEDLASGLDVVTEHEVQHVSPGPRVDGEAADAVVLAMPGPQAARLLHPRSGPALDAARAQRWLPALAATVGYPERVWPDFDGAFVNGDDVLETIFDDGARRGDGAPVLVAHTTAAFAVRHLADPGRATGEITAALARVAGLPAEVRGIRVHRWNYARPDGPGEAPFHLDDEGIGLCGDAWGSPRVETAWLSGTRLGEALLARDS